MTFSGFCPLASGSKGNALYLASGTTRLLIDGGISCKAIEERLHSLGVSLTSIDAILVSHDHIDHIQGLRVLTKKYQLPIFANLETARGIAAAFKDSLFRFNIFTTNQPFTIGDLRIHPFSILHDTLDPVAFRVSIEEPALHIGICTDLGMVTPQVEQQLAGCHFLHLEANHQPELVETSCRPAFYKQRVLGPYGHLSNESCGELLSRIWHPELHHVHLAHLSSECNTPAMAVEVVAEQLYKRNLPSIPISVAYQKEQSRAIDFSAWISRCSLDV